MQATNTRINLSSLFRVGVVIGLLALLAYGAQAFYGASSDIPVSLSIATTDVTTAPSGLPVAASVEPSLRSGMPIGDGADADQESYYSASEKIYSDGHAECVYGLFGVSLADCKRNTADFRRRYIAAFGEAAYAQRGN